VAADYRKVCVAGMARHVIAPALHPAAGENRGGVLVTRDVRYSSGKLDVR